LRYSLPKILSNNAIVGVLEGRVIITENVHATTIVSCYELIDEDEMGGATEKIAEFLIPRSSKTFVTKVTGEKYVCFDLNYVTDGRTMFHYPNFVIDGPGGTVTYQDNVLRYCEDNVLEQEMGVSVKSGFLKTVVENKTSFHQLFSDGGIEEIPFEIVNIGENFAVIKENGKLTICEILRPWEANRDLRLGLEHLPQNDLLDQVMGVLDQYTQRFGNFNRSYKIVGYLTELFDEE
jgi:hypothetical protein